ncbi:MAG: DNA repair exonuclease [Gemmataceae bacterium]|nr:DNA repair exonuclease [Gemmataceae bacterium]
MLVAHLSDLHLGRKSPGDAQGAERLNSFRQALTTLAGAGPDVIVIAGDAFDGPNVEPAIIDEAARSLVELRSIPVVIIPGNHDPADADRLWTALQKAVGSSSVHLVREARIIALADGKLLVEAYPCLTRFSDEPPWEQRLPIPAARPDAVRVVVAHGTLQGGPVPEGETDTYPFTDADLEALGADYVALGHFHGVYPAWGDGEACQRSFSYCGTHEPDQFGGDAGYAILASVAAGQPVQLRRVKTGRRQWRQVLLTGPADLAQVERLYDEAKSGGDPGRYVIRLKIQRGSGWSVGDVERLEALEAALLAVGAQVERRGIIQARVDVQALDLQGLPTGAVKEALLSLQRDLDEAKNDNRRDVLACALQVGWDKLQEASQ